MSAADMLDRSGRRGSGEEFERRGLVKKESEGTERSRDSRRVVSGDARHGGTEISILVRFEASNVVYAIDETGEM
jgi:hypothetical protein